MGKLLAGATTGSLCWPMWGLCVPLCVSESLNEQLRIMFSPLDGRPHRARGQAAGRRHDRHALLVFEAAMAIVCLVEATLALNKQLRIMFSPLDGRPIRREGKLLVGATTGTLCWSS